MMDLDALKANAWRKTKMQPRELFEGAWNWGAEDMAREMRPELERLRRVERLFRELHDYKLCKCGETTPDYFKLHFPPGHSRAVCSPAMALSVAQAEHEEPKA